MEEYARRSVELSRQAVVDPHKTTQNHQMTSGRGRKVTPWRKCGLFNKWCCNNWTLHNIKENKTKETKTYPQLKLCVFCKK